MWYLYIIFGMISGILGGMGMGGGTALIPLLTIFLSVSQILSQGYNLLSFLMLGLVAIFIHLKNNLIDFSSALIVVISGVVFAVGGSFLAQIVPNEILRIAFGILLLLLGIYEVYKLIKK